MLVSLYVCYLVYYAVYCFSWFLPVSLFMPALSLSVVSAVPSSIAGPFANGILAPKSKLNLNPKPNSNPKPNPKPNSLIRIIHPCFCSAGH